MNIELKNVKCGIDRTTDHRHFSATVYLDGVKSGEVNDDGWGGGYSYYPAELADILNAYGKTLPPYKLEIGKGRFVEGEEDCETLIGEAINKHEATIELKKLLKKKIVYIEKDTGKCKVGSNMDSRNLAHWVSAGLPTLVERWKIALVLNNMPFDCALPEYRKAISI